MDDNDILNVHFDYTGINCGSLFKKPFTMSMTKDSISESFYNILTTNSDVHRNYTIVVACVVEGLIDKIYEQFFPKYKQMTDEDNEKPYLENFTFGLKISILDALNFIPNDIIEAARLIKDIRNAFAHNLGATTLAELHNLGKKKKKLYNRLKDRTPQIVTWWEPNNKDATEEERYHHLSIFCIIGLKLYANNIKRLRDKIESDEFITSLDKLPQEIEEMIKIETERVLQELNIK